MAACSSTRIDPSIVSNAVRPVRRAIAVADDKVTSAQSHTVSIGGYLDEMNRRLANVSVPVSTPELMSLVVKSQEQVDALTKDLLDAKTALKDSNAKVDQLESTAVKLVNDYNKAVADKAVVTRRYDKIKFGICTLLSVGFFMLLMKFKPLLAFIGPYAWIIFIAGPTLVWGLTWKVIDWVL